MAIYNNLYSKRNKSVPEVFTYTELSQKLRIQILRIWDKFFENAHENNKDLFNDIKDILCDEYGTYSLCDYNTPDTYQEIRIFFGNSKILNECLDVIELVFITMTKVPVKDIYGDPGYLPSDAVDDLNARFLENGVGFELRNGEIIRVDNKLLHQEIIIPALHFLSEPEFYNANEEYLSAHEHFRHVRNKECLNDCLKSLETTLKIICDLNGWQHEKKATASTLIDVVIAKKLIPDFLQEQLTGLRITLKSGVPTVRNNLGGHGQGTERIEVPMHYASYMLYLTGTTINFLVSCQQELKLKV